MYPSSRTLKSVLKGLNKINFRPLKSPMAIRSLSLLLVLFLIFIQASKETTAEPTYLYTVCQNERGNYTNSSDYKANLDTLLSALPSTAGNGYGFYSLSAGRAHAVGLCRGDIGPGPCRECLENATRALPLACPNQKEAFRWYDECLLRYSNRSVAGGAAEYLPRFFLANSNNVSSGDAGGFFDSLRTLLEGLRDRAAAGGSLTKFAAGNRSGPGFLTVYALVQCTPDLSLQDCNNCLGGAFEDIPRCCAGKIGGRVVGPSCNFRYENYLFYDLSTVDAPREAAPPQLLSPSPPSNDTTTAQGNGSNTSTTVIIVVSSALASVLLIILVCVCLRMKKKKKTSIEARPLYEPVEEIETVESLQYSFETIRVATDNFSEANKLGQGGFGPVYKGRLPNGLDVAVKRLSKGSGQGDLEFKNEVKLVAKLQHRNLVRLLGFCFQGSHERLLIYEFVPNASLDHFIFDPTKRANLGWERRHKIIGGIARGLLYLHEDSCLTIIHRDLKASNILLDEEMRPKISDFGMARLFVVDQTQGNTSCIVGTYGYMAPEYAMHGQFSAKSDVFSFGVLLLEIVSGQKNNCFRHGDRIEDLLSFAWKRWRDGTASNIVDPLTRGGTGSEIMRCVHIALLCVQENVANRPTMSAIVRMLNSNSLSLPVPSEPAFFMHSNIDESDLPLNYSLRVTESDHSTRRSAQVSVNEASTTDPYPR